ncbi:hypothetical protein U1Q18_043387 [Sarracenia purpurea var. burkii]
MSSSEEARDKLKSDAETDDFCPDDLPVEYLALEHVFLDYRDSEDLDKLPEEDLDEFLEKDPEEDPDEDAILEEYTFMPLETPRPGPYDDEDLYDRPTHFR